MREIEYTPTDIDITLPIDNQMYKYKIIEDWLIKTWDNNYNKKRIDRYIERNNNNLKHFKLDMHDQIDKIDLTAMSSDERDLNRKRVSNINKIMNDMHMTISNNKKMERLYKTKHDEFMSEKISQMLPNFYSYYLKMTSGNLSMIDTYNTFLKKYNKFHEDVNQMYELDNYYN